MGYTSVRKCIHIEINARFNPTHEGEWSGETVSNICKRYGTSRKTYYKRNNRYKLKGMEDLSNLSTRRHTIKYKKITPELEETILDLRLTKRFGCNRIKFRLRLKPVATFLATAIPIVIAVITFLTRHG